MPRPRRWTDEQLRDALPGARSLAELCHRLEIPLGGKTFRALREGLERIGLPTDHPMLRPRTNLRRSWTDEDLAQAVAASSTHAEFQRPFGV